MTKFRFTAEVVADINYKVRTRMLNRSPLDTSMLIAEELNYILQDWLAEARTVCAVQALDGTGTIWSERRPKYPTYTAKLVNVEKIGKME